MYTFLIDLTLFAAMGSAFVAGALYLNKLDARRDANRRNLTTAPKEN